MTVGHRRFLGWDRPVTDDGHHAIKYWDGTSLQVSADKGPGSYLAIWALESGEAWAVGYGGVAHRRPPG